MTTRPDITKTEEQLYFADYPTVVHVSSTTPVAAKPYRCTICGGTILRGEKHSRMVYRETDALDPKKAIRFARFHFNCPPYDGTGDIPLEPGRIRTSELGDTE